MVVVGLIYTQSIDRLGLFHDNLVMKISLCLKLQHVIRRSKSKSLHVCNCCFSVCERIDCLFVRRAIHFKKQSLSVFPPTCRGLVAGHTALVILGILWYFNGPTVDLYTDVEDAKDNQYKLFKDYTFRGYQP